MPLLMVFFIPIKEVNGELVPKEWDEMKDDEKRKVQDDQKAKNDDFFILQGAKAQRKYGICLKSLTKAQRM